MPTAGAEAELSLCLLYIANRGSVYTRVAGLVRTTFPHSGIKGWGKGSRTKWRLKRHLRGRGLCQVPLIHSNRFRFPATLLLSRLDWYFMFKWSFPKRKTNRIKLTIFSNLHRRNYKRWQNWGGCVRRPEQDPYWQFLCVNSDIIIGKQIAQNKQIYTSGKYVLSHSWAHNCTLLHSIEKFHTAGKGWVLPYGTHAHNV
jgi:hypothetical protein